MSAVIFGVIATLGRVPDRRLRAAQPSPASPQPGCPEEPVGPVGLHQAPRRRRAVGRHLRCGRLPSSGAPVRSSAPSRGCGSPRCCWCRQWRAVGGRRSSAWPPPACWAWHCCWAAWAHCCRRSWPRRPVAAARPASRWRGRSGAASWPNWPVPGRAWPTRCASSTAHAPKEIRATIERSLRHHRTARPRSRSRRAGDWRAACGSPKWPPGLRVAATSGGAVADPLLDLCGRIERRGRPAPRQDRGGGAAVDPDHRPARPCRRRGGA